MFKWFKRYDTPFDTDWHCGHCSFRGSEDEVKTHWHSTHEYPIQLRKAEKAVDEAWERNSSVT